MPGAPTSATPLTKTDFDGIRQRTRKHGIPFRRTSVRKADEFMGGDIVMRRTMRGQGDLP